jgi:hypothetical protein
MLGEIRHIKIRFSRFVLRFKPLPLCESLQSYDLSRTLLQPLFISRYKLRLGCASGDIGTHYLLGCFIGMCKHNM